LSGDTIIMKIEEKIIRESTILNGNRMLIKSWR